MEYVKFIGYLWMIFLGVWAFLAIDIKKSRNGMGGQGIVIRIVIFFLVLFIFRSSFFDRFSLQFLQNKINNPFVANLGVLLCAIGIGFAIWARVYIGKNWGRPMSVKEKPELITTGPYAYVRHPIYTGITFAMFGSAVAISLLLLIPFVFYCVYFSYSAKTEEKNMTKEFPKEYPRYMKKTKKFVPFLL